MPLLHEIWKKPKIEILIQGKEAYVLIVEAISKPAKEICRLQESIIDLKTSIIAQ